MKCGGHESAPGFTIAMYSHNASHRFSDEDMARMKIGHAYAISDITALTSWQLMSHIFSDPTLLADIPKELSNSVVEDVKTGSQSIDISSARTAVSFCLAPSRKQFILAVWVHQCDYTWKIICWTGVTCWKQAAWSPLHSSFSIDFSRFVVKTLNPFTIRALYFPLAGKVHTL